MWRPAGARVATAESAVLTRHSTPCHAPNLIHFSETDTLSSRPSISKEQPAKVSWLPLPNTSAEQYMHAQQPWQLPLGPLHSSQALLKSVPRKVRVQRVVCLMHWRIAKVQAGKARGAHRMAERCCSPSRLTVKSMGSDGESGTR